MKVITFQEPLLSQVTKIAQNAGQSTDEFVINAVRYYMAIYRQKRIQVETEAWYSLSFDQRKAYQGQYVAVYDGKVIDSDDDRSTLFHRVRQKLGNEPVAIIAGGDTEMPTYQVPFSSQSRML